MSVEGRTHKPVIDHTACNTCSVCMRACPAEVISGLKQEGDNLRSLVYGSPALESVEPSAEIPPCQKACPLNQDIRGYVSLIANGQFEAALDVILKTNPLPLICGYVCHRPCETACIKQGFAQPVPIRALKLFVASRYHQQPGRIERSGSRDKISIIGSGPAGLSAAFELARQGFQVELIESHQDAGGMLSWAIPDFRLPREAIQSELRRLERWQVTMRTGVTFGKDITCQELFDNGSKAVIIATGTMSSLPLKAKVEKNKTGLHEALNFLKSVSSGETTEIGSKVLVIGGGNAAVDTARSAIRLGADEVRILYRRTISEMTADPAEVKEALHEGVHIDFQTLPIEVIWNERAVTGLKCAKTEMVLDPDSSRLKPVLRPDSEYHIPADAIISAIGQVADYDRIAEGLPAKPDWISTSDSAPVRNINGLFVTGDFINGSSTVVEAMASGMRTAAAVIDYLKT